jgi:rod shape determining protein RodA
MIHSATVNSPDLEDTARKQAVYGIIGLVLALFIAGIDYRALGYFQWPVYIFTLLLLVGVKISGHQAGGAQRWLTLGPLSFQPSEFVKLFLVLVVARFLAEREGHMKSLTNFFLALALLAPPVILIYTQPDLGTAISILFVGGVMILMSGVSMAHVAALIASGAVATPFIWQQLHGYMRERIRVFLNPSLDPVAFNNIRQALISIGSGGLLGQGYRHGSQSQLHFLRVRHTDYIFSVVAEEWGFLGTLLFFLVLLALLFRMIRVAENASDQFGRMIVVGMTALIYFQVVVNIGMNMKMMPVTGIPLPFVSYGRSSLIALLMGIGLVESVAMRSKRLDFK